MTSLHKGHIFGLNTKKGIAIMQIAEEPVSSSSLLLTRICSGFLDEHYTDEDIFGIVSRKELFFMNMPLQMIGRKSKIYSEYFAFDKPFQLPSAVVLPKYLRGYTVLNDGTVHWYKKRRGSNFRRYVKNLKPDFLQLSPDTCWSLPDICEFLESGKTIADYI